MKGVCLTLYTYELEKHHGILLYEWLLEQAKKQGIHGGSVFRAVAGYGLHHVMHEAHFLELGANVPVEIRFILENPIADNFLAYLKKEGVKLFYTLHEVMEYGRLE